MDHRPKQKVACKLLILAKLAKQNAMYITHDSSNVLNGVPPTTTTSPQKRRERIEHPTTSIQQTAIGQLVAMHIYLLCYHF